MRGRGIASLEKQNLLSRKDAKAAKKNVHFFKLPIDFIAVLCVLSAIARDAFRFSIV
jgi:hypothetical protein